MTWRDLSLCSLCLISFRSSRLRFVLGSVRVFLLSLFFFPTYISSILTTCLWTCNRKIPLLSHLLPDSTLHLPPSNFNKLLDPNLVTFFLSLHMSINRFLMTFILLFSGTRRSPEIYASFPRDPYSF